MYRKFSLVNSDNATWNLTDPLTKTFANNPDGLGLRTNYNGYRLGNKVRVSGFTYEFINKNFEIIFYGDTQEEIYANYSKFVQFITTGELILLYEIPSDKAVYRIKILINELNKTEIKENGYMSCNFSMTPLSFWEDSQKNTIIINSSTTPSGGANTNNLKSYPLTRPYAYAASGFDDIEINTKGNFETPIEITITGEVTDPKYNIYNEDNKLTGVCKLDGSFDLVYINSDEIDEELLLLSNGLILPNPYNYQDIEVGDNETTKITFLTFNKGYNKMTFNLGSTFEGSVKIEWRNRYISI